MSNGISLPAGVGEVSPCVCVSDKHPQGVDRDKTTLALGTLNRQTCSLQAPAVDTDSFHLGGWGRQTDTTHLYLLQCYKLASFLVRNTTFSPASVCGQVNFCPKYHFSVGFHPVSFCPASFCPKYHFSMRFCFVRFCPVSPPPPPSPP